MRGPAISRSTSAFCAMGMLVYWCALSTSRGQDGPDIADGLNVLSLERETVRRRIAEQITIAEGSQAVKDIQERLTKVEAELLGVAKRTPQVQEIEEQEAEIETKIGALRLERLQIVKSAPELSEVSTQLKKAEEAVRDAKRTGKTSKDMTPLQLARDKAKKQLEEMQSAIPDIKEVDEKIRVLMDERRRLGTEIERIVKTDPKLRSLTDRKAQLEAELQSARNAETPELKRLRARDAELRSVCARLLGRSGAAAKIEKEDPIVSGLKTRK